MKFILGLVLGLVLGGSGYAVANHESWHTWMNGGNQPGFPQPYMDLQTGQIQQLVPVLPQQGYQRNPC